CGGISINKQWICTVKFTCFYLNAVALVSTSNEFEYPNSLVRGVSPAGSVGAFECKMHSKVSTGDPHP
ncbi:MAG: hypothetical protein IJ349_07390, partial [Clostridia bacterium]|nr:hypothetical protein [Clostridia bacterium]